MHDYERTGQVLFIWTGATLRISLSELQHYRHVRGDFSCVNLYNELEYYYYITVRPNVREWHPPGLGWEKEAVNG